MNYTSNFIYTSPPVDKLNYLVIHSDWEKANLNVQTVRLQSCM